MKEYEPIEEQDKDLALTGTPEERAEKMREIYDSLDTMEEKLEFLVKNEQYREVLDSVDGERPAGADTAMNTNLIDQFIQTYVIDGTDENHAEIFRLLYTWITRNNLAMLRKQEEHLAEIPADDPEREKKAYYLTKYSSYHGELNNVLNALYYNIKSSYTDKPNLVGFRQVSRKYKINDRTTMGDLIRYIGYNEQEAQQFLQSNAAQADTPAIAHYLNKLRQEDPDADRDAAVIKILDDIMEGRDAVWKERAVDGVLKERGYTAEKKQPLGEMARKNTGDFNHTGIDPWIREEGKAKLRPLMEADRTAMVNEYRDTYVRTIEKRLQNRNMRATSSARIRRPSAESYGWIVNKNVRRDGRIQGVMASDEQFQQLKIDTHLDTVEKTAKWDAEQALRFHSQAFYDRVGKALYNTRNKTVRSQFIIWALGNYDHVTVDNMTEIHENPDMIEAFAKYCEDHPTVKATDEETFRNSVRSWTDIYLKATEKIKEFSIPVIDHKNPARTERDLRKLCTMNNICLDFMQEMKRNFNNELMLDGVQIAEETMGKNKWNNTLFTWSTIQNILIPTKMAYQTDMRLQESNSVFQNLSTAAANQLIMEEIHRKHPGKTVGAIMREDKHYFRIMANVCTELQVGLYDADGRVTEAYKKYPEIPRKDVIKYLNGKDKKTFRKKFAPILEDIKKKCYDRYATFYQTAIDGDFMTNLEIAPFRESILAVPENDPRAVQNYLADQSVVQTGTTRVKKGEYVSKAINSLFNDAYRNALTIAGVRNKMDAFLIDGRTPEAIWGRKYKGIADAGLKQRCLQFEVLKKLMTGDTEIRIKTFAFDKDNRIRPNGSVLLAPTTDMAKRLKYNYEVYKQGMDQMIQKLETVKVNLLRTHPGFENTNRGRQRATREIGRVGSSLFRKFENALSECIRVMKDKTDSKPEDIRDAMKKLEKAAANYYKGRKPLFGEKSDEGARTRLSMSGWSKNNLPNMITRYLTLRQGVSADLACGKGCTLHDAPIHNLEDKLWMYEKPQYAGMFRQDEVNLSEETTAQIGDKYKDITRTIRRDLKQIGKDMDSLMILPGNPDPYDAAMSYYLKNAMGKIMNGQNSLQELENKKTELDGLIRFGTFQRKAEELSRNPVFRECIRQNGAFDYEEWRATENNTVSYINQLKAEQNRVDGENKDVAKYVLTGIAGRQGLAASGGRASVVEARYQRLGDYLAHQILTEPKNRMIVNAICSGRMKYEDVVKDIVTGLKNQKVFTDQSYDPDKVREKIASGALKNQVTETILKQAAARAKTRTRVLAGQGLNVGPRTM